MMHGQRNVKLCKTVTVLASILNQANLVFCARFYFDIFQTRCMLFCSFYCLPTSSSSIKSPYIFQQQTWVLSLTQENAVDLYSMNGGLLLTNKERSAFPRANYCQGQLQTPRSVNAQVTKLLIIHFFSILLLLLPSQFEPLSLAPC